MSNDNYNDVNDGTEKYLSDESQPDYSADVEAMNEPFREEPVEDKSDSVNEVDIEALKAKVAKPAKDARYQATGKRKTSVARVIMTPGEGFWINGRSLDEYFVRARDRGAILEPLKLTGADGAYHVRARIHGGGITGQTGALKHGIAKALAEIDPGVRSQLKSRGFLKVDTRQVERKKAGLKKARKRPQFSKR